jgi:hypothetical protein
MMLLLLGFFSNIIDKACNHHLIDSSIAYFDWFAFTFFMVQPCKSNKELQEVSELGYCESSI